MSLSTQVLVALGLGIAAGLGFGEVTAFLQPVGDLFIRLLQMTVLPFVVVSMIAGVGRLSYAQLARLGLRVGAVLLVLWAAAVTAVIGIALAFPDWEAASFFSTTLVDERPSFSFMDLYIPANPFHSLANSVVPAVVFFSLAVGVALIGVEEKARLLDVLDVLEASLMRLAQLVANLAPYGVFALTASAAGTMNLQDLARLQVYVVSYTALALLMALWLLPGLVTVLTPVRYGDLMGRSRDALVTAFATGSLFIVLPLLVERGKEAVRAADPEGGVPASSVDVIVPVTFNFPTAGKLLSLAFVPFAAWFLGSALDASQLPQLLGIGVPSFFAAAVVAVPFMLDVMRIPADAFQLYVSVDVVTSRFGTMLAATHLLVVAVLGSFAVSGRLAFRRRALLRYTAITATLFAASVVGPRLLFTYAVDPEYTKYGSFVEMDLRRGGGSARVVLDSAELSLPDVSRGRLEVIRARGSLRVGFFRDSLPFAFSNADGREVGFDVEMAHELAESLGVELVLVRVDRTGVGELLDRGACDVVMSGVAVTPERLERVAFSIPYMDGTLALLVADHRRSELSRWSALRESGGLTLGLPDAPYYVALLRQRLPRAKLEVLDSPRPFLQGQRPDLDGYATIAEAGSAWTLVYPRYAVALPEGRPTRVPLAYPVPRASRAWRDYVDAWLELKRRDGTIDALFEHWILGRGAEPTRPRWSLARDVFGWID